MDEVRVAIAGFGLAGRVAHVPLAEAALDHGVAAVVDKPLALDARSAARLRARATEAALPLSVFHNRRWDSDLLTLRRLLAAGALGRVLRFESRFERWRPGTPWGVEPQSAWGWIERGEGRVPVPSEPGDWPAYYRLMVDCLREGGPLPVDPADAVAVAEVLEAARQSAAESRVVALAQTSSRVG